MIVLGQLQLEDTRGENGSDSRSILLSSDHAKAVAQDKSQSSRSDQKFRIKRRENCVSFMISTRIPKSENCSSAYPPSLSEKVRRPNWHLCV